MPRRIPHTHHWNTADTQEELVSRATTTTLALSDLTIRLADVPLFRNGATGLEQGIRVRVDGERSGPLTVTSSAGGTLTLALDQSTGHLFVPEVASATPISMSATLGADTTSADITVN